MQINEKELQKKYRKELEDYRKEKKEFDFSGDISFENVSYTYSKKSPFEFKALDQTSFLIKRDKITCVIGNTGSGKSTLIQLTNGLLVSETGRTLVGDYPIPASIGKIKEVKQLRKEIGLVFQFPEYQLFQDTVEKDISFGPINLGLNKEEAIKNVPNLLKIVSLPTDYKDRSPFDLSGGQKRRVAIAGIIAMNGNTLVLDEPTGGLDPKGENDFMNLFESLNKEHKKRIIMVTHNMDQVLRIADDVIVLNKGKMMAIGSPSEIFSNQKLLDEIGIEPPKIFQLMYKLKEKGINLLNQDIRNIEDFALAVKNYKTKNTKKETKGDIK